jgi:hypothetical protein
MGTIVGGRGEVLMLHLAFGLVGHRLQRLALPTGDEGRSTEVERPCSGSWLRYSTLGLTMLLWARRAAPIVCLPNMMSSLEKPKTKASLLSMSVTFTRSSWADERRDASSSPPDPAPCMTT